MNETLLQIVLQVGDRYRRVWRDGILTVCWTLLALAGLIAWSYGRDWPAILIGVFAVFAVGIAITWPFKLQDRRWLARHIERRFPDLDSRLITSLEQQPDPSTGRFNFLQRRVVEETIEHARRTDWPQLVPSWLVGFTRCTRWASLVALIIVVGLFVNLMHSKIPPERSVQANAAGEIKVEPGDTSVERGSAVLVLARFAGAMPADVKLLIKSPAGTIESAAMSKSLDDPVFAARMPRLDADLQYAVQHGGQQTQWFKASVFEYPELKQADAELAFPQYTKLPAKKEQDVRSVTAVEGTTATITLKLNKPVTAAELRPAKGEPIKLSIDPNKPDEATARIELKQSQKLTLALTDADGRQNKTPAAELALNVNPNRPPELKPVSPGRDVDVSPIQELSTGVRVSDDFGVSRVGVSYGLAGRPATDVTLASDVPGGQKRDVSQLVALEPIGAKPDELLSYYFWAEDVGPDGKARRTASDMYFAEVRPFEEIFRQGQQQSESEQRQQQQQQQNGQSANGQQAEQLAELQKQIIAATWKIIRRETGEKPTDEFAPDVKLLSASQTSAREQAAALGQRLTDPKSAGFLKNVLEHMDRAISSLDETLKANTPPSLSTALSSEQAAYQALLRLRAREFDVTRGNRQQQQQGQSASSASSRRQQQLDQLQLEQEQNRYETQRSAQQPPNENPQQRETRQVLNRLKELAQRQEDLNRQMQEMKSALDQAKDQPQREEIERQLARLRDQQAEQLRDTDELRDRMNRPESQENLADARQQLEQTRENVRRASEALRQNQLPEAATSGARASEQLNNLRDQVRRGAAGELAEAMTGLRQQARELDANQQKLAEQLKDVDANSKPSLRDGDDRKQLAEQLGQQKQNLDQLTDAMRKTVEASENSEPLVSKQLYDTLRQSGQQQTDKALDVSRQLLDRGFTNEARQAEAEASRGISQLRQGVEQAATGVLGDEAEALRRAKGELDRLADELQREVARQRPQQASAAGPATRPTNRLAANGPTTQSDGWQTDRLRARRAASGPSGDMTAEAPTTRRGQLALGGERQDGTAARGATSRPGGVSADEGDRRDGQTDQGQDGQPGQSGQPAGREPGGRQPGEQTAAGNQPGRDNGERNGQNGQPGERPGEQAQANAGNDQQPRPGDASQRGQGGQPGEANQPGQAGEQGERANGPTPGNGSPRDGQRPSGPPGLRGSGNDRVASGRQPGERDENTQPSENEQRPGDDRDPQPGDPRDARNAAGVGSAGDPNRPSDGRTASVPVGADGPLTGGGFREWSDRLRDVEEMIADPALRDRVARVRERARDLRADVKRHSKAPNWEIVQETVVTPLDELRDRVSQELLRRTKTDALVPLDREGVPPQYAEQVRQYYERLGAGR